MITPSEREFKTDILILLAIIFAGIAVLFTGFATTAPTAQFVSTTATSTRLGGVKVGLGLSADGDGTIAVNTASFLYTLPAATGSTLGGVKVGANINVTPDGTISATPGIEDGGTATTSLQGVTINEKSKQRQDELYAVAVKKNQQQQLIH